ncbi:MAG: pyridoxal phosphate-dependent aminotransferase, partial [Halobacteriota archaeon]
MSLQHSARVAACEPSSIRVMFDLAEATDRDLVRLEVGQPDFDTPEHVIEAADRAARAGHTGYTANAGRPELRRAVAETLKRNYGVPATPEGVTITVGGMEALHLTMLGVVDPGEEVVLPSPVWPNYPMQVTLAGGRPIEVSLSAADGYALDAEAVVDRMGPNTAAVVLCTPSN